MQKTKKYFFILTTFLLTLFFITIYLKNPLILQAINNKIRDDFMLFRGKINTTQQVVIIDIDEKSLKALGQWPWNRDVMAKILKNLTNAGAGIIGLDMFFPENDTKSPAFFAKKYHLNLKLPDTDKIFANAIATTPTILGFLFDFDKNITLNELPNIPAIFIEKNLKYDFLLKPKGYISNITTLQNNAYSGGFVNIIPDNDGVVRYVPLLIKYNDEIYPSLSFEMIRLALGINKVFINYNEAGVFNITIGKLVIPTDRFGRIFVNYRGDKKTFRYISASDIYKNNFNPDLVKNKFILIGTSAAGLFDLRVTPFNNVYPGVEVHANVIDNILKGDYLIRPDFSEALEMSVLIITSIIIALSIYYFNAFVSLGIILILNFIYLYGEYYLFIKKGYVLNIATVLLLSVILSIVLITINYFFEVKQSEKLKKAFSKKVSPSVMNELLKNPTEEILKPKEKEITIFFSDIRSFTTISEKLKDPKLVIELLNTYMTPMVDIIVKQQGTIDKFIGDAIMAYWNAPADIKNHADKAVSGAIMQIKKLKEVNKILQKKFNITIDIGIGINTGITTVGEMGSKGRADYTVIGDSVNLASRLEGLNKVYHSHIIISEFTKHMLKNDYSIRELDLVKVKGKTEPIKIYEVLVTNKKIPATYYEALKFYRNSEFDKAKKIFEELYQKEKDLLYNLYIDRCNYFIKNPPENFDGIWTYTTK